MTSGKDNQESIQQLQLLEQNLQGILAQKQQFQSQLFELENALKEISSTKQAYKIVGGIMVAAEKDELQKDLNQKKEIIELRITSIEKQEKQLQEKAKSLQQEIIADMKKEK